MKNDLKLYICENNSTLKEFVSEFDYSWKDKYLGRKIKEDKFYEYFGSNGYYFDHGDFMLSEYEYDGIYINLCPVANENGIIENIKYYKIKETTTGPRSVSHNKDLSKQDITIFCKLLEYVTYDFISDEYENFCQLLKKKKTFPNGYIVTDANKRGISVQDNENNITFLKKDEIINILYISHKYIDVLYDEETLKEANKFIKSQHIPIYLAICSTIDYKKYKNYKKLLQESKNRKIDRLLALEYPKLVEAVKNNDIITAKKYIKYAKFAYINDHLRTEEHDLINEVESLLGIACKNNDIEIAKLLIKNGGITNLAKKTEKGESFSPLYYAIEHKNYKLQKLLIDNHGAEIYPYTPYFYKIDDIYKIINKNNDIKALCLLLPYIENLSDNADFDDYYFNTENLTCKFKDILPLLKIDDIKIIWDIRFVKEAYIKSRDLFERIVTQNRTSEDVLDFLVENREFELLKLWLPKNQNKFKSKYRDHRLEYIYLWEDYEKWGDLLKDYVFLDKTQCLIHLVEQRKYDDYINFIETTKYEVTIESLDGFKSMGKYGRNTSFDYTPSPEDIIPYNRFMNYIIDHLENGFELIKHAVYRHCSYDVAKKYVDKYYALKYNFCGFCYIDLASIMMNRDDDLYKYVVNFICQDNNFKLLYKCSAYILDRAEEISYTDKKLAKSLIEERKLKLEKMALMLDYLLNTIPIEVIKSPIELSYHKAMNIYEYTLSKHYEDEYVGTLGKKYKKIANNEIMIEIVRKYFE